MAPGKRRKNYSEEDLAAAIQALKGGMSSRAVAEQFGIPKTTILDRATGLHGDKMGQPPVLTDEEEQMICEMVVLMGQWGFPFTGVDLRHFIKAYLDKRGAVDNRFTDNLPTHRWLDRFIGRHPTLSLRKANAIKRARAAVSREEVSQFFENFIKSVEGVDPSNIINYDETNFRDDVSLKKCIVRKGTKYCETVLNTSKQALKKICKM
jgi:4-hydroxybenzoate polyprenyltransferase